MAQINVDEWLTVSSEFIDDTYTDEKWVVRIGNTIVHTEPMIEDHGFHYDHDDCEYRQKLEVMTNFGKKLAALLGVEQ